MFDVSILGLTVIAMLLVWWAYRKWHGRGYLTAFMSVLSFAVGAFLLYLHFTGAIFGRIKTPDSTFFCPSGTSPGRCAATYFRETDPTAFWLTLAFWILVDTAVIAAGAFGLYRLWRARQRGQDTAQD